MEKRILKMLVGVAVVVFFGSCSESDPEVGKDPNTAEEVSVDRFSAAAATLMVRTPTNGLPEANVAVDFDQPPFITRGLTPAGMTTDYYNFDVQATAPAPIWVLFNSSGPVPNQLNIVDVIPGDAGYNDFWQVFKVTVPDNYIANTVVSYSDIVAKGYTIESTTTLVNCPVVPKGSTATKRFVTEDAGLARGWYKGKIVYYFTFSEKALMTTGGGMVPLSPIYVTFNINPGDPDGGPASGFVVESATDPAQTHNVVATIPADGSYSPLWSVNIYDNSDFSSVSNLSTAMGAMQLAAGAATVNCPIVFVAP